MAIKRAILKTTIYYFSGTGNSLWVALDLAQKFGCEAVPMVKAMGGEVDAGSRRVGLVFPTYMYRPPHLVVEFLKKLPPRKKVTVGLTRYHHPDVKRKQIIQQRR